MAEQIRWTLAMAFTAGLLPGVVFGLWMLALIRARSTLRSEARWGDPAELERELARLRIQNKELEAALAVQAERGERLDKDLQLSCQRYVQLQRVFTREQERISRTVSGLKKLRLAWLRERERLK